MKHCVLLLMLQLVHACSSNINTENALNVSEKHDYPKISKALVRKQIRLWNDSTVFLTSLSNGDKSTMLYFYNDSICGYTKDSIAETYTIQDKLGQVSIQFSSPYSAFIDAPSIYKFHIYKYESMTFYGVIESISPTPNQHGDQLDTAILGTLSRYLDLIK